MRAGALAGLLVAACAVQPASETRTSDAIAARIDAVLMRRGLGSDALSVIDNVIRHEGLPPRAAPPIVREMLAHPLTAADAAKLFERAVPAGLRRLAESAPEGAMHSGGGDAPTIELSELLGDYLAGLAEAQRLLRASTSRTVIDGEAIVGQFGKQGLPATLLRRLTTEVEPATLDQATTAFIDATARFAQVLIERGASVRFPPEATRFDSPIGTVSIGTRGDDHHGPDAAIIIDPGGDDSYERAPATGAAISVILDLGGDDRYHGVDVVVQGLSAIIDLSGNDRYAMSGPGVGAAVVGASVLVDFAGDDVYEAMRFGQGAAAFGVGAVIELAGNDSYRVQGSGQGYGMARGLGLLWDRVGDDTYTAAGGARDAFDRGGGISMAQGAARGVRTSLGGGVGILRDDEGNDAYEAEMFAQGVGYYNGVGLLWDRAGDDRYRAVRYAQGNGVHEAAGILRDEAGDDRYELTFGVGQGMGLDLAIGMLFDGAGDDRYQAQVLAQGAATANGVGIIIDGGGADEWSMGADPRSWGRAEWARGLPSLGLLLYDPAVASFMRGGKSVSQPARRVDLGGPLGDAPATPEPAVERRCAQVAAVAGDIALPFSEALRRLAPGFAGGATDPAIYADIQRRLKARLRESLAELPHDDFDAVWSFGRALQCAFAQATGDEAEAMWAALEHVLGSERATPIAGPIVDALRERPPPAAQAYRMLHDLDAHPWCSVRASALRLRLAVTLGDTARAATIHAAQAAMVSSCWRLQAAARSVLGQLGVVPADGVHAASFLRSDAGESSRF